jgi:hypothetical protein
VGLLIDRTCKAFVGAHGSHVSVEPVEHTSV